MTLERVTRRDLARELVVNATTQPVNVVVPAVVAVAGILLDQRWLLPLAVVVYAAMVVATFFDTREAKRVGQRTYTRALAAKRPTLDASTLSPAIRHKLELAYEEEKRIGRATAEAPTAFVGLTTEVRRLMEELRKLAERAQRIDTYLADQDEPAVRRRLQDLVTVDGDDPDVTAASEHARAALNDQLEIVADLRRQLARFHAHMEHIAGSLGTIHGQIVRMSVTEEAAAQADVAAQVRDLRREVSAAADAMREAYGEVRER